ncbi:MAG: YncE family protein [Caulobacterales bacterium]
MRLAGVIAAAALQLAASMIAGAAAAAPTGHEYVYVQATMTKDIYVVDAETFQVAGHVPIGDYTDDVIGSPDGRLAFANAQISSGSPLGWQANEAGKVMAIDTATDKIVWSTFVEGSPHHLAVDPSGSRVFVPLFDRNYLVVLDAHSGQVLAKWYATLGNHGLEMSRDGRKLYVGNMISDRIWVYDTQTGRIIQSLAAGEAVRPLHLDADETHLVYQLSRFHGFKVRDLATDEVRSVDLPALPPGTEQPGYPYTVDHGLAFTPDHHKLLAAGSIAGYVAVYSVPDYRLVGTVKVGDDPNWIAVRSDSRIAFVSNRGSGTLSVIDIDTLKELKQIPVGKMPQRLSVIDVPNRP